MVVFFYPLTRKRMESIQAELAVKRVQDKEVATEEETTTVAVSGTGLWNGLPKVMRRVVCILAVILAAELVFVMFN